MTVSDTPRTDAATRMAFSGEHMVPIQDAQKLERELADIRTIFVSYILSEEAWRESKKDPIPMLIEANFMREKAKEVLGL